MGGGGAGGVEESRCDLRGLHHGDLGGWSGSVLECGVGSAYVTECHGTIHRSHTGVDLLVSILCCHREGVTVGGN